MRVDIVVFGALYRELVPFHNPLLNVEPEGKVLGELSLPVHAVRDLDTIDVLRVPWLVIHWSRPREEFLIGCLLSSGFQQSLLVKLHARNPSAPFAKLRRIKKTTDVHINSF